MEFPNLGGAAARGESRSRSTVSRPVRPLTRPVDIKNRGNRNSPARHVSCVHSSQPTFQIQPSQINARPRRSGTLLFLSNELWPRLIREALYAACNADTQPNLRVFYARSNPFTDGRGIGEFLSRTPSLSTARRVLFYVFDGENRPATAGLGRGLRFRAKSVSLFGPSLKMRLTLHRSRLAA